MKPTRDLTWEKVERWRRQVADHWKSWQQLGGHLLICMEMYMTFVDNSKQTNNGAFHYELIATKSEKNPTEMTFHNRPNLRQSIFVVDSNRNEKLEQKYKFILVLKMLLNHLNPISKYLSGQNYALCIRSGQLRRWCRIGFVCSHIEFTVTVDRSLVVALMTCRCGCQVCVRASQISNIMMMSWVSATNRKWPMYQTSNQLVQRWRSQMFASGQKLFGMCIGNECKHGLKCNQNLPAFWTNNVLPSSFALVPVSMVLVANRRSTQSPAIAKLPSLVDFVIS